MISQNDQPITDQMHPKKIGERIKFLRESLGLTQTEFAAKLRREPGTISRWERGDFAMHLDRRLREIIEATGVSREWLRSGVGEMSLESERLVKPLASIVAENATPYRAEAINAEILTQALSLVLQELQNRKATLPPSKIAAAVVEIYELVTSQGKKEVALDNVTPFVRLLLAR